MRINKLLPAALIPLALSATVACGVETSTPPADKPAGQTQSAKPADAGGSAAPASSSAPAAGAPLKIDGTGVATGSTDCAGRDVLVDGQAVVADLTGTCGKLTVKGTGNVVNVEKVAAITVGGTANVVTWGSAPDGGEPKVSNSGTGNTVIRK